MGTREHWKHHRLRAAVSDALNRADPIGLLRQGASRHEYDQEVEAVVHRLSEVTSAGHLEELLYEEFIRWFGAETAGNRRDYRQAAEEIWRVLDELGPE